MKHGWMVGSICVAVALNAFGGEDFSYTGEPLNEAALAVVSNADQAAVLSNKFRIAAYNVENLTDGIGDDPKFTPELTRRHAEMIAVNLGKINPDIVLLQEVENSAVLQLVNSFFTPPYPYAYLTQYGTGNTNEQKMNEAVLSRVALEDVRELDFGPLQGSGRPTRGMISFTVNLGDQHKLLVYGVHLKSNWGPKPRNIAQRQHALTILNADAKLVQSRDTNTAWEAVILGDTNVDPEGENFKGDPSFEPISDWVDLWLGRPLEERITWATRYGDPAQEFPSVAFDRFFVTPSLQEKPWFVHKPMALQEGSETNDVTVLPGEGRHISDHYPIYLDIER